MTEPDILASDHVDIDHSERGVPRMISSHFLLRALQDDREREIRRRAPRVPGIPSGPRHAPPERVARRVEVQLRPTAASSVDSP